jgi:hypothetical protein
MCPGAPLCVSCITRVACQQNRESWFSRFAIPVSSLLLYLFPNYRWEWNFKLALFIPLNALSFDNALTDVSVLICSEVRKHVCLAESATAFNVQQL